MRQRVVRDVSGVVEELDDEVSLELEELGGVVVVLVSELELGVVLVELLELGVVELGVVELGVVELELVELGAVDDEVVELELGVDMSVVCDLLRVDLLQAVRDNAAAIRVVALTSFSVFRLISFPPKGSFNF